MGAKARVCIYGNQENTENMPSADTQLLSSRTWVFIVQSYDSRLHTGAVCVLIVAIISPIPKYGPE